MKVESRGKYAGVKIHLDEDECQILLDLAEAGKVDNFAPLKGAGKTIQMPFSLAYKMGKSIREKLEENPDLLKERTQEEVIAILAKESEKAGLQLKQAKSGLDWKKVDQDKLQDALMKHVHKD